MSLFRLPKFERIRSTFRDLRDACTPRGQRPAAARGKRRLVIDPLEQRQLLAVSTLGPMNVQDMLINQRVLEQTYSADQQLLEGQYTIAAQSLSSDHDGDFVVAWTRFDPVMDAMGNPIIDPETGNQITDANIYARYFTDEVQRISLPDATADDVVEDQYGRFSLTYGGSEVQKLTFTAAYEPFALLQEDISASFTLGFDVNGNGSIDGGEVTPSISFDEMDPLADNAEAIQTALRGLGGALGDVEVLGINPHEYVVYFGDSTAGDNQPALTVESATYTTGFLPSIQVSTLREPTEIGFYDDNGTPGDTSDDWQSIPVSPTDPWATARVIEQAFTAATAKTYPIGPYDFPPPDRANPTSPEGPYEEPEPLRTARPKVTVQPVVLPDGTLSLTQFDVTYVDDSGKQDHPEVIITQAQDDLRNPLAIAADSVSTRKETSAEFRVNPAEPEDPFSPLPDVTDQTYASVAMDSDGEFVIVWQSEVRSADNFGSVSDIYARRFAPMGVVPDDLFVPGQVVPGVRSLEDPSTDADDVQILTFDATVAPPISGPFQLRIGGQTTAAITFDSTNLTGVSDAIETELAALGYEGAIVTVVRGSDPYRLRVTFDGESGGTDQPLIEILSNPATLPANVSVADASGDLFTFRVNQFTTNAQYQPHVGMDGAGNFVIAWANLGQDISYFNGIIARRYDRHGAALDDEFLVNTEDTSIHFDPYVGVSRDGHFGITWTRTDDPEYLEDGGFASNILIEVYNPLGDVLHEQFDGPGSRNSSVVFDMDNNFVVTADQAASNDSFGNPSSDVFAEMWDIDQNVIRPEFRVNSASFNTDDQTLWPHAQSNPHVAIDADGDLVVSYAGFGPDVSEDAFIDGDFFAELINAEQNADLLLYFDPVFDSLPTFFYGSSGAVDGRIEEVLIEAINDGATDEQLGRLWAILDGVAGLMRGEANGAMYSRWDAGAQPFELNILDSDNVANAMRDGRNSRYIFTIDSSATGGNFVVNVNGELVTITPVFVNGSILPFATADAINAALEAATVTGVSWPEGIPQYEGPVDVRLIFAGEVAARTGTPWELVDQFGLPIDSADYYIYEITYQGEVHDSLMSNFLWQNNLEGQPISEVQLLTFSDITTDGWFALSIGDTTTENLFFDSANPGSMAGAIANQLEASGFDGVSVIYLGGGQFQITFGGNSSGVNQPPIIGANADIEQLPEDPPPELYPASNISSFELVQGGTPPALSPIIISHTEGDAGTVQSDVTISMEPDGDFVMVWTQYDRYTSDANFAGSEISAKLNAANANIYYRQFNERTDTAGPLVTDLVAPDGTRVDQDGIISSSVQHLVLTFDEEMLAYDADTLAEAMAIRDAAVANDEPVPADVQTILDSVTNPENYQLFKNDSLLEGAIISVQFGMSRAAELAGEIDPATGQPFDLSRIPSNKWEAVITVDGSAVDPGVQPLATGFYEIVAAAPEAATLIAPAQSGLRDRSRNPVGRNGFVPEGEASSRTFMITESNDQVGEEFRINEEVPPWQTLAESLGTGLGQEDSNHAMAVDHDGDFAVVWTSYGQDDPGDSDGAGVYMRLFNRDNAPLTSDILVNETVVGDQTSASIAMDADGDFIVVWQSEGQDPDGSSDIYARRFDSVGQSLGGEFRVNTETPNDQVNPAVATDLFGNFVVVWATAGQNSSYFNNVRGQLFDAEGQPIGEEFQVNEVDLPGTVIVPGSFEINPAVAMARDGSFLVAWDQVSEQLNGVVTDTIVVGRLFDATGLATTGEFQVDNAAATDPTDDTTFAARNPQITVDSGGNYTVVYESFENGSYDVFFQQYDAEGTAGANGQVNQPEFAGAQVNPSVGVDADGDFAVAFNGNGAQPNPLDPANATLWMDQDTEGVFVRSFNAAADAVSVESRVNRTAPGLQQFPTIGMEPDGDFIVVWSGNGVGDRHGVFGRRYDEPTDTAGPLVTDLMLADGERISDGEQLTGAVQTLRVVFDEEMRAGGPASPFWNNSVENPANYRLFRDGVEVLDAIVSIDFALNPLTNKWEAELTLDGNGSGPGAPPLASGEYRIVVRGNVRDVVGNVLGKTGYDPDGEPFERTFNLLGQSQPDNPGSDDPGGDQTTRDPDGPQNSPQAVASDADGETATVWTDTTLGQEGIYVRLFNGLRWSDVGGDRVATGPIPSGNIRVTDNPTAEFASIARDGDGDFVVTWSQNDGTAAEPDWNVWARRYDAVGSALGSAFMVNSETFSTQRYSSVAMDVDGDFVITWQSLDQDGDGYGIYAQRFSPEGDRVGGTNEIQALDLIENPTGSFTLRWDGDDNPATANVTGPIQATGNPFEMVDQIQAELNQLGGGVNEVEVFAIDLTRIGIHFVGPGAAKNQRQIVVNSSSFANPASDIETTTLVDGDSGEFRVNDTTEGNQLWATLDMSAEGNFVVTWTSEVVGADDGDSDIYAKRFTSNDAFRLPPDQAARQGYDFGGISERYPEIRWATTTDNPDNHIVDAGAGYDGVIMTGNGGSGVLLQTGRHIITAAHVVDAGGGVPVGSIDIVFDLPGGPSTITASEIYIHPGWNGDITNADDLAIIVLPREAPIQAERYDIYRGDDELNNVVDFVGYGTQGQGAEDTYDGLKRKESNVFEFYGEALTGLPMADFYMGEGTFDVPEGKILMYDFDSGLAANDAFGLLFGRDDLGLGEEEGSASHGDSGGAAFLDGILVGVTSGGFEYANADSDDIPGNVSFGTIGMFTRVSAYADWIDTLAQTTSPEFLVNDTLAGQQKWSDVALDADGDFVVTWTSFGQDATGTATTEDNGVFAKRYNADGTEVEGETTDPDTGEPVVGPLGEFRVNTFTAGDQQHSQVDMDADGDFTIVWESFQDRSGSPPVGPVDNFGIFAQRYAPNAELGVNTRIGPNGEIGGELAVNQTKAGDQRFPSIALDDTGDTVIVWSGAGPGDPQGVFQQTFYQAEDDAGPTVTDVLNVVPAAGGGFVLERVVEDGAIERTVSQAVVRFGENLVVDDPGVAESVETLSNWQLTRDGQILRGGVATVSFGLNETVAAGLVGGLTNKYEAVITFDGDPAQAGIQPLGPGQYTLTIRDRVEDLFGNKLDGNYDGTPGFSFGRTFVIPGARTGTVLQPGTPGLDDEDDRVNVDEAFNQDDVAVASDAAGNYIVVWADQSPGTAEDAGNIMARRYNRFGDPISGEFIVNSYRTGLQVDPDVAMDDYGNFVVVWSGQGEDETSGVFGRVFSASGVALGEQFRVNQYRDSVQDMPSVGMDENGDFVVAWTSYGQDGDTDGIFARRYSLNGVAKGNEFQVNSTWTNRQENPDVSLDAAGNFVIVWADDSVQGNTWDIRGQRFTQGGVRLGGEFRVNTNVQDKQIDPQVAAYPFGGFVVTWASFHNADNGYDVYARWFNAAGQASDGQDVRINQTTEQWQVNPAVDVSARGDTVFTWATFDQETDINRDYGIYGRIYPAGALPAGTPIGEYRVNATVEGDQLHPAVAVDADGDFVMAWSGPDADGRGIYQRLSVINPDTYLETGDTLPSVVPGGGVSPWVAVADSQTVAGTVGDDVFEVTIGATSGQWTVTLNGVPQAIDPAVVSLTFQSNGGNDTVRVTATDADDTITLSAVQSTVVGGWYSVTANGAVDVSIDAAGGADEATFSDSPGDDTFAAGPGGATMFGSGMELAVSNVETMIANASTGTDIAKLYDSPADDLLITRPTYSTLEGGGYSKQVNGFYAVHGYATAGGNDVAKHYDSAGDDVFAAGPIEATLFGDTFFNRAKFFEAVHAYATAGGTDVAKLYDSAGDDQFDAYPTEAALYGDGFYMRAKAFDGVHAYATAGGTDVAKLYDSAGDDTFVADPNEGALFGDGFYNRAKFFEGVHAYATADGADVAKLYDSAGNDTFVAGPIEGALFGDGFYNRAKFFDGVHAYASAGGSDTAKLYDSAGDDIFVAQPGDAALFGTSFYNRAKFFDGVHAYATVDGTDVAHLYDSAAADTFSGSADASILYGDGFYNRAKFFEQVHAHADGSDDDTALLFDAVLESGEQTPPAGAKVAWLYDFESCLNDDTSDEDPPVEEVVDDIMTAYWP